MIVVTATLASTWGFRLTLVAFMLQLCVNLLVFMNSHPHLRWEASTSEHAAHISLMLTSVLLAMAEVVSTPASATNRYVAISTNNTTAQLSLEVIAASALMLPLVFCAVKICAHLCHSKVKFEGQPTVATAVMEWSSSAHFNTSQLTAHASSLQSQHASES